MSTNIALELSPTPAAAAETAVATTPDLVLDGRAAGGPRGLSISGATITQATSGYPEPHKILVRWVYDHAQSNHLNLQTLAERIKLDTTTLWRVMTGKYLHPETKAPMALDNIAKKIAAFKSLEEQRSFAGASEFVPTEVWEKIDFVCRKALVRQKIVIIYGESQIGKTRSLKEYARQNNHGQTTYVETPPAGGVQEFLRSIAAALHVSVRNGHVRMLTDVLGALDSSKLLILDEAHRVFTVYRHDAVMRVLDLIRHLHDQTGCGLVISCTNVFRDHLERGEFSQYLKQFERRCVYTLQLPDTASRKDLDLVCAKFGLPPATGQAEKVLLHIAQESGLGMIFTRLTDGRELAAKKDQPYTWDHFLTAFGIISKMSLRTKGGAA